MNKVVILLRILFGLGKSLYINLSCLGLKGFKLPILVSHNTKIKGINKHTLAFSDEVNLRFGLVRIGIVDGSEGIKCSNQNFIGTDNKSKILITGPMTMAQGATIKATNGGILEFGKDLSFNYNNKVLCKHRIKIGDNILCGWNITFSDADGHTIFDKNEEQINYPKEISIGSNVWIGFNATILKGAKIPNNSVVGCNSLVNRKFEENNVILGGIPAIILKQEITWQR